MIDLTKLEFEKYEKNSVYVKYHGFIILQIFKRGTYRRVGNVPGYIGIQVDDQGRIIETPTRYSRKEPK